ncbi:MAG: carbamoyltransferase [Burkholderiales bacterium]|nr:carbamoyltransferase [Bacteroidia bacterium]
MQKPQKYFIGLTSCYHDSAISIVDEQGKIVFAEATERYTQNKRSLSMSADNYFLIKKILKKYSISDYEIGYISRSFSTLFRVTFFSAIIFAVQNYLKAITFFAVKIRKQNASNYISAVDFQYSPHLGLRLMAGTTLKYLLNKKQDLEYKKIINFDHHLCHAYHAYFTAPVNNSIIFIIDGFGDNFSSYSIYSAKDQNIQLAFRNKSPTSLGDFYGEITNLCGFDAVGGEQWKVMGMAPYGKKNELLYNDFKSWIYTNDIELKSDVPNYHIVLRKNMSENKYKNINSYDLAFTAQLFFEEIILQLINTCHVKWPHTNLIISGGCALNSASNGKIHTNTPYKNVFIPSAPADDGCSVGAALLAFKKFNPNNIIPYNQTNPYLGFEIQEDELTNFLSYSGYNYKKLSYPEIYLTTAKYLENGKIIAWVQGRAEFGPRALGNRSILANACLPEMKDLINSKVKFREEFRPFAPAVLEEYGSEFFEDYYPTPFMERVLKIKQHQQYKIPAVKHIDGTGRLQTVTKKDNIHFYNLIVEFHKLCAVPILLNTSLNIMGKPIVSSVNDIASVFTSSGIDVLVINDYIITKPNMD